MKPKSLMAAAVALVTLMSGGLANATTVSFTISGVGNPTMTFTLPINPIPDGIESTGAFFNVNNIQVSINGASPVSDSIAFLVAGQQGGMIDSLHDINISGEQYFSGPLSSPTFIPGVYTNQFNFITDHFDTTVTIAAETPLPTALPLFATGLGALGLLGWRRKRKQAV
jgi:hypothetical protein